MKPNSVNPLIKLEIRELSTSSSGSWFAAGEWQSKVHVWSLDDGRLVSSFPSILNGGGRRLAITADGTHCAIGSYGGEGMGLYESATGREIWRRKELKKVQIVRVSQDDQHIMCGFDEAPGQLLSRATGKTVRLLRGIRKVYENPYGNQLLLDKEQSGCFLADEIGSGKETNLRVKRKVHCALFTPSRLFVSEFGGSCLRCVDIATRDEVFRSEFQQDTFLSRLGYRSDTGEVLGVLHNSETSARELVSIDQRFGALSIIVSLGHLVSGEFCRDGLLCSDGRLWDVSTGAVRRQFWQDPDQGGA